MGFLNRLSNGMTITRNSLKVLNENRQLIIFPLLSGAATILIIASYVVAFMGITGWDNANVEEPNSAGGYAVIFLFYISSYFIVVFFNMALVHCASLYFRGQRATIKDGLTFSLSRIKVIFTWALLAGSIGAILKIIQENVGTIGKIITGLIGIVWGIATFFVVPVIAYENLGPIDAFKRSSQLMKEKWGERIGAGFSLGLLNFLGFIVIAIIGLGVGALVNPLAGIVVAVLCGILLYAISSAVKTIFVASIYQNVTGDPVELYNQQFIDNLFVYKK